MKRGASAVLTKPPLKRVPSDAPGRNTTGSGVADDAAVFLRAAVHGAVVPHVLRPGLRVPRPAREEDGLRDADRGGPVAAVAARPGALFLLPRAGTLTTSAWPRRAWWC